MNVRTENGCIFNGFNFYLSTTQITRERSSVKKEDIHNMRERPTIKLVELSINNHIVDLIDKRHIILQVEYSTSAPNERVSCITQLAKLSFNHSIGPGITSC